MATRKELKQSDFKIKLIKDLGTRGKAHTRYATFECPDCFKPWDSQVGAIKNGKTSRCKECGIKNNGLHNLKHGKSSGIDTCHGENYCRWKAMKQRCDNPKNPMYEHYGLRGITYHEDFKVFEAYYDYIKSLQNANTRNFTIDRIDNDLNYDYGNLQWAEQSWQSMNTKIKKSNTSGYVGVKLDKSISDSGLCWHADLRVNSKKTTVGFYKTKLEAAKERDLFILENELPNKLNHVLEKTNETEKLYEKRITKYGSR